MVAGIVIGVLLLLNIISIILLHTTEYGKSWLESVEKTTSKGFVIFMHFWFLLFGVCFWILAGILELKKLIVGE